MFVMIITRLEDMEESMLLLRDFFTRIDCIYYTH